MSSLWWTKPTESGLCDRLVDVIHVLAYARMRGMELHFLWPAFVDKPIDCRHRVEDILLSNIRQHIVFPEDVKFSPDGDERFDIYIGGDANASGFHQRFLKDVCSLEAYQQSIREVAADFSFCEEIERFLSVIPERFAAVHIRRGDKVRDEPSDGCFINRSELSQLNALTYKALDFLKDYETIFFCGDEDEKIVEFKNYVENRGQKTFQLPPMEKWRSTYFDIAVMSRAKFIVTSTKYSAFSRFSAILGDVPIKTAYQFAT